MIRLSSIIIFLSLSLNSIAQNYKPMLGNTNYWYLTSCVGQSCLTDFYYAIDDTVAKGNIYKVLDSFHYNRTMLIREDTALRRVYAMPTVNYSANKELILYDFSLPVGGIINLYNPNSPAPNDAGNYMVDSITNIQIKTGTHRAFYLSEVLGSKQTIWIEGVGALSMATTPSEHPNLQGIGDLSCFYRDGIQIYESDSLANGSCDTTRMATNINLLEEIENTLSIFPNPFNESIAISINSLEQLNFKLLDITGRVINQGNFINQYELSTLGLPDGVYVLSIFNENYLKTKQLIKTSN